MVKKFLKWLLLFEKFEIKTKLSKNQILKRIESFIDPKYNNCLGAVTDDGFYIFKKSIEYNGGGHTRNSFVPTVRASISETGEITTVSAVLRMNILVWLIVVPIYLFSLFCILPFPIAFTVIYFLYMKPAEDFKESLIGMLTEA